MQENPLVEKELIQNSYPSISDLENLNRAIIDQMVTGVCRFAYTNEKGEAMIAFGTLNTMLIPKFRRPDAIVLDLCHALSEIKEQIDKKEDSITESPAYQNMLRSIAAVQKELKPRPPKKITGDKETAVQVYYDIEKRSWLQYKVEWLLINCLSLN